MDFAWPISEHEDRHTDKHNDNEPKSSAMDFVMNAWSLLRGTGGTEQAEGKSNIAQVSLAAAGGASNNKDVDFVKESWALYQQAMEEGWVTEWIENFTTSEVVLIDNVRSGTTIQGQAGMARHYNSVLDSIWDNGRVSITWRPRSFASLGSGVVMAEYDIEVQPKGKDHPHQLWIYRLEGQKIAEIRMFAIYDAEDSANKSVPTAASSPSIEPTILPVNSAEPSECPPTPSTFHDLPHTPQLNHAMYTPIHRCIAPDAVSVGESMPSLSSTVQVGAVGVSLTRPCHHNSWDNVRIKRGWAILRCRICQLQWRLRPTAIPHCPEFARGAGCCSRGIDCHRLHVHRTRETKKSPEQQAAAAAAAAAAQNGMQSGAMQGNMMQAHSAMNQSPQHPAQDAVQKPQPLLFSHPEAEVTKKQQPQQQQQQQQQNMNANHHIHPSKQHQHNKQQFFSSHMSTPEPAPQAPSVNGPPSMLGLYPNQQHFFSQQHQPYAY